LTPQRHVYISTSPPLAKRTLLERWHFTVVCIIAADRSNDRQRATANIWQVEMCTILTVVMSDISPDVFGTAGFQRKLPGLERLKKTAEQRRDRRHQAATPARLLAHHDNLRCLRLRSFPTEKVILKTKKVLPQSRVKNSKTLRLTNGALSNTRNTLGLPHYRFGSIRTPNHFSSKNK
ncbi:hypothetical protein KCU99_g21, partial [Aureobasidium melanogenum]